MSHVKIANGKIEGEYDIYFNHVDGYYNCFIPGYSISFFTKDQAKIDFLARELVVRFFKIRLDELEKNKKKGFAEIASELLAKGFKSNSMDVKKRARKGKSITLTAKDSFKPGDFEYYKTDKMAA